MKKGLFLTLFLFLNLITFSQSSPRIEWQKTFQSKKNETAYSIVELSSHNFALSGAKLNPFGKSLKVYIADKDGNLINSTAPKMIFNQTNAKLSKTKSDDMLVCGIQNSQQDGSNLVFFKINQYLKIDWEKTFSSQLYNFGGIAIPTADGGFAIAFSSSQNFEANVIQTELYKLNTRGGIQWHKTFSADSIFKVNDIIQTTDNGFLLTGVYSDDGQNGTSFILKTDKNGNIKWQKQTESSYPCEFVSIVNASGGYILAGNVYNASLTKNIRLVKYGTNGNIIWDKNYGGNRSDDCSQIIADNGGFVIAGSTKSKGSGGWDAYIFKIDANGNKIWEKTVGGMFDDKAYGITKAFDGGYVFAGYTQSTKKAKKQVWLVKLTISIREQATAYVQSKINEWQKKGKYEKLADYQARVNENTRKKKIYELTNEFFGKIGTPIFNNAIKVATLDYDTESEIFRINLDYFNPLYVPVPIDDAPDFEKNFQKMQFSDIVFRLTNEDKLEIAQMTIKDPVKNKFYFYDATIPVIFNNEEIVTDFDPIVIPGGDEDNSDNEVSDVDTDIPNSGKTYPNRFALIIGNAHYIEKGSDMVDINYSINDAKIFRKYAVNIFGIPDDDNHIYYIEDANATFMRLYIDNFAKLIKSQPDGSEFFIFYSGHGTQNDNKEAFLVPVGVTSDYIDQFGIKLSDLYNQISPEGNKKVIIFFDACFSGGGKTGQLLVNAKTGLRRTPNNSSVSKNLLVFAAASEKQIAQEYLEKKHGLFTYYLLKNLKDTKGQITYGQLADRVINDVNTAVLNPKNKFKKQTPVVNVSSQIQNLWKNWKINN